MMKRYTRKHPDCRNGIRTKRRLRRRLSGQRAFRNYLRSLHRDGGHRLPPKEIQYNWVEAPEILSFVRNPEEVCGFIGRLRECFDLKKPVFVSLKQVKELDYDGITVLLSVVIRFKSQAIPFNGNFPRRRLIRKNLTHSGFFRYLYRHAYPDKDTYSLASRSAIFTHAKRNVDAELGERLIAAASQTVWGEQRRCTGVQRTFIELMQNTNNHASLDKLGDKHWWLSVKHDKPSRKVSFSFVDYGVGIFRNLRNKPQGAKFHNIISILLESLCSDDADVLAGIFHGLLHRTASQKYYRGKGLPGIYEAWERGAISNLALITNNVFFNSATGEYRMLDNEFRGTFVYWELEPSNEWLPPLHHTNDAQGCN